MNQELMDMATKVGIEFTNDPTETPMTTFAECWIEELEAFAALVAAAEREKVAKQWEQWHGFDKHTVAAFIRARGETK
jgi:hypothetical protein